MRRRPADYLPALLEVARSQHGVVLLCQLHELGLSPSMVTLLVGEGWLRRIRPGAYGLASAAPSVWEAAVAVALVGEEGIALSHSTAAEIHRLPGWTWGGEVELTAVQPRHPRTAGVVVHRVAVPFGADRVLVKGVPVTTPARTFVDLSSRLGLDVLARVLDEGCIERMWDVRDLMCVLDRLSGQGRKRRPEVRRLLEDRLSIPTGDSWLEAKVIKILQPYAPFEVHHQVVVDGNVYVLDVAWPPWKVAVEADGWEVRSRSRSKFDADRRKANALAAHGWTVVHVTSVMGADEILGSVRPFLPRWASAS